MSDSQATQSSANPDLDEAMSGRFAQFVLQQANLAMMLLGRTPHPQSGETLQDLEGARMFIEQLEMIEAKTKGNLGKEEQALLKQSLMSVHLAFVEAVEATQESPPAAKPAESRPMESPASTAPAPEDTGVKPPVESSGSDVDSKKKFSKKY